MNKTVFKIVFIGVVLLTISSVCALNAQVAIGQNKGPESFSVLELISSNTRGLRLPQLTQLQRDTLDGTTASTGGSASMIASAIAFAAEKTGKAMGLQIFNTTTLCVETWNGIAWIAACDMCGGAPCIYYPPSSGVTPNSGNITTFVNVMYDFQQQTIEAYGFAAAPVSYQWYVKRKGAADTGYKGISGATALTYTAPANFIKDIFQPLVSENNANYKSDSIIFVCLAKYANGTYHKTPEMDILFIGTNTAGYGESGGVKYLLLGKGNTTPAFKVALTNLDDDPNTDAKNLGDFYQWGRIADGHQKTAWGKGANHINSITPMTGGTNNTSAVVARNAGTAIYDANGQLNTSNAYNQSFITNSSGDWGTHNAASNNRWGDGSKSCSNRASDILLSHWTSPSNNPCPLGWRVPSRWNFWDLYRGVGTDTGMPSNNYQATNNNWVWRAASNNAVGGAVITNANGEKLFLPALGIRFQGSGSLLSVYDQGFYWSSTYFDDSDGYALNFYNSFANPGSNNARKANGFSIRCVVAD